MVIAAVLGYVMGGGALVRWTMTELRRQCGMLNVEEKATRIRRVVEVVKGKSAFSALHRFGDDATVEWTNRGFLSHRGTVDIVQSGRRLKVSGA